MTAALRIMDTETLVSLLTANANSNRTPRGDHPDLCGHITTECFGSESLGGCKSRQMATLKSHECFTHGSERSYWSNCVNGRVDNSGHSVLSVVFLLGHMHTDQGIEVNLRFRFPECL